MSPVTIFDIFLSILKYPYVKFKKSLCRSVELNTSSLFGLIYVYVPQV